MTTWVRHKVSKKKKRFEADGYDLDLAYITDNIIAMGFPSEKVEGMYRNPMDEVKRFLNERHANHYHIYNLCSERQYDPEQFDHRVARYGFDDHNAPPFDLFKPFCQDVDEFLNDDARNVVVVHCKAGKGRTGVMIVAYLLHSGRFTDPEEAMEFYGKQRTYNGKGVTIPSQRRYIGYYAQLLREQLLYSRVTALLVTLRMHNVPLFACKPFFTVKLYRMKIFKSVVIENAKKDHAHITFNLETPLPLCGDIKFDVFSMAGLLGNSVEKMFHFWINTFFIHDHQIVLTKPEIDKAHKDKKHKKYPENFKVELLFIPTGLENDVPRTAHVTPAPTPIPAATTTSTTTTATATATTAPTSATASTLTAATSDMAAKSDTSLDPPKNKEELKTMAAALQAEARSVQEAAESAHDPEMADKAKRVLDSAGDLVSRTSAPEVDTVAESAAAQTDVPQSQSVTEPAAEAVVEAAAVEAAAEVAPEPAASNDADEEAAKPQPGTAV